MTDVYTVMGKYEEALAYINKMRQVTGNNDEGSSQVLLIYALTGKQREATAGLATRGRDGTLDLDVLGVASIYAALGDHDHAVAVIEKAVDARSTLAYIFADLRLDPLRTDHRFQQLLRRAKIPP
jgi:tetratricopeptide (TPR) repeat protein